MSLAKLYREKVAKHVDGVGVTATHDNSNDNINSNVSGGTFITQNPNEMGVPVPTGSYETSKLTILERKQRELSDMQNALAQKKLDYESRMSVVNEKEATLKQRQEVFTKFVENNSERIHGADAKLCRATRRIDSEIRKQSAVVEQIKQASKKLNSTEHRCTSTKADLDAHFLYEGFLSEVVDKYDSFSSTHEVLTRYETLKSTQEELQHAQTEHSKSMDSCSRETQALLLDTQNETLLLNSELLALGDTLDDLTRLNHKLETEFAHLSQGREGMSRLSAEIQMSVQNLYEITQASYSSARRRPLTAAAYGCANASMSTPTAPLGENLGRSSSMTLLHALLSGCQESPNISSSRHITSRRLPSLLKRIHARIMELESIGADFRVAQAAVQVGEPLVRSSSMKSLLSSNTSEVSAIFSSVDENCPSGNVNRSRESFLPPIFPSACK